MDAEIHAYWQQRLNEACAQRDELCDHLRGEVNHLQNRCQEMAQINAMGVAKVCFDIHEFAYANAALTPNGTPALPLEDVINYLHQYSNGIVPHYVRQNKRDRGDEDEVMDYSSSSRVFQYPASARQPVTPTVAQLLAQRQGLPPQRQVESRRPPQVVQVAQEQEEETDGAAVNPADQFRAEPQLDQAPPVNQQMEEESPKFASCGYQHYVKVNRAIDPHVKRPRGIPMDDECTQLTPWNFSRTP